MTENISITKKNLEKSDLCGFWEVIRISQEKGAVKSYPWIRERFKFNFLPEMNFLCMKDGGWFQGTWLLSEKSFSNQKHFSLVLNETFEYKILNCDADEMILSDHHSEYLLTRKL